MRFDTPYKQAFFLYNKVENLDAVDFFILEKKWNNSCYLEVGCRVHNEPPSVESYASVPYNDTFVQGDIQEHTPGVLYCAHMEPNEQTTESRLERLEKKVDAVYESVEKTRSYFQIVMWVTIAMVVLPLIGLVVVIPTFIKTYLGAFDGLL